LGLNPPFDKFHSWEGKPGSHRRNDTPNFRFQTNQTNADGLFVLKISNPATNLVDEKHRSASPRDATSLKTLATACRVFGGTPRAINRGVE
jgi:hypothetical protein